MITAWWRAGRGVRPAVKRVPRGPERRAWNETASVDTNISYYINVKEESHKLHLTGISQGDPQAQGGHPDHGFRRHPAGEQGRSLPPPALPASLSLFRSEDWVAGRRSGRASEPGKFYGSTEQEKKGPIPSTPGGILPDGSAIL